MGRSPIPPRAVRNALAIAFHFSGYSYYSCLSWRCCILYRKAYASNGAEGVIFFKKNNPESDDNLIELGLVKAPKNIEANSRRPGFINFAKR
ncbi:MAG: hypothetical protein WAK95_18720 [Desulfobacterales bacterium]